MTDVTTRKTTPDGNTTLDELLALIETGEDLVITREDVPVARLIPAVRQSPRPVRRPGLYAGMASIGPEFFEPLPEEELRLWEGGDDV